LNGEENEKLLVLLFCFFVASAVLADRAMKNTVRMKKTARIAHAKRRKKK